MFLVCFFSRCGQFPPLDIRITNFYQSEDLRRKVTIAHSFIAGGIWSEAKWKRLLKVAYVMIAKLYLNSFVPDSQSRALIITPDPTY